jgi:hypothetical protein
MKLRHRVGRAGCSGPVNPAASPACRGWRSGKLKADGTSEEVKYRKTNPTQANLDCHKPYYGSALNSFGASVGSRSKANVRGSFLHAAGCLYRDRNTGSREISGSLARQHEDANRPKQSHRITTRLLSNSSLAMTYIIRGQKSPGGQTQPLDARDLDRKESHESSRMPRESQVQGMCSAWITSWLEDAPPRAMIGVRRRDQDGSSRARRWLWLSALRRSCR